MNIEMTQDSDEHLIRYLLGELPQADAERLDERSITDDALAFRLSVLENDLVDGHVRGEASGVLPDRFARAHSASPYLAEKTQFAEALHALAAHGQAFPAKSSDAAAPRRLLVWTLASAAALTMVVAGYALLANQRLRNEVNRLEARHVLAEQQNARLQQQFEATRAPATVPPTAVFLLPPPRRGAGHEAMAITVPNDTRQVALRFEIESDDYERFWAAVKDLATGDIVWRSSDLVSQADGADRIVTMTVPVSVLRAERYVIQLSGIGGSGSSELVGEYLIRMSMN